MIEAYVEVLIAIVIYIVMVISSFVILTIADIARYCRGDVMEILSRVKDIVGV